MYQLDLGSNESHKRRLSLSTTDSGGGASTAVAEAQARQQTCEGGGSGGRVQDVQGLAREPFCQAGGSARPYVSFGPHQGTGKSLSAIVQHLQHLGVRLRGHHHRPAPLHDARFGAGYGLQGTSCAVRGSEADPLLAEFQSITWHHCAPLPCPASLAQTPYFSVSPLTLWGCPPYKPKRKERGRIFLKERGEKNLKGAGRMSARLERANRGLEAEAQGRTPKRLVTVHPIPPQLSPRSNRGPECEPQRTSTSS